MALPISHGQRDSASPGGSHRLEVTIHHLKPWEVLSSLLRGVPKVWSPCSLRRPLPGKLVHQTGKAEVATCLCRGLL